MDLLGAYDSNSDSDEDGDEQIQTVSSKPATASSSTVKVTTDQVPSSSSSTAKPSPGTKTNLGVDQCAKKAKKRGKKLLKLSAVLPDHIWNQLMGGGGGGIDDDVAEDSDGDHNDSHKKKQTTESGKCVSDRKPLAPFVATMSRASTKDSGLANLLLELPKSKSTSYGDKSSSILGIDDDDGHLGTESFDKPSKPMVQQQESLGFAFVNSTVETTKRKRTNESEQVLDIHAHPWEPSSPPSHPKADSTTPINSSSLLSQATQQQPLPRPLASRTVPLRPAAPLPAYRNTSSTAANTTNNYHCNLPSSRYDQSTKTNSTATGAASLNNPRVVSGAGGAGASKKKQSRKRQMEQMLRAGKFHEIQEDHALEGTANIYQPSEVDAGPAHNAHGVRVVPTTSYNVGAGTTVASTDISGRQRNKHQLNSLLASAASLEAQRAQNPHYSSGGKSGTSHRANAKQKYGW